MTDYRTFVATWKNNTRIADVATALDMTEAQVSATATKLRKAGVVLPKYTRGAPTQVIDVDSLNALLEPEQAEA